MAGPYTLIIHLAEAEDDEAEIREFIADARHWQAISAANHQLWVADIELISDADKPEIPIKE